MNMTTSWRTEPEDVFCQRFNSVRIFFQVTEVVCWIVYGMSVGWC